MNKIDEYQPLNYKHLVNHLNYDQFHILGELSNLNILVEDIATVTFSENDISSGLVGYMLRDCFLVVNFFLFGSGVHWLKISVFLTFISQPVGSMSRFG